MPVPRVSPPIAFGPIPSRRLGRSIGINNIPPKVCSYSCAYCQVGPTTERTVEPRGFHAPAFVAEAVARHVAEVRARGERIDHLSFVPDGEPTLDAGLGPTIELLRPLGIPVAVITNGSLLWRPEVRAALEKADWVSVKVDAATTDVWKLVNRPDPNLDLVQVHEGIARFVAGYRSTVVSETMLVAGVNDGVDSVAGVADVLARLGITTAFLAIPTRPTPHAGVTAPTEEVVTRSYHLLVEKVAHVELLVGYEGDAFAASGDARRDLLSITAVHPMRASAVGDLLERSGADWQVVDELCAEGLLAAVVYRGERFWTRRFPR